MIKVVQARKRLYSSNQNGKKTGIVVEGKNGKNNLEVCDDLFILMEYIVNFVL